MANKYKNFGFRRDKNLSDSTSEREVLSNILNNLAISGNDTFIPEDIYVINGLKGTNVTFNDFAQLSNTYELVYDPDLQSNIPVRPHVTLNDRLNNYKLYTGDPVYGPGGIGLPAKAIPQSNISNSITELTDGDTIFIDDENVIGPFIFWDDGNFVFGNSIYPDFEDSNGMIQWDGYFTPDLGLITNTIIIQFSGFLLIEENRSDTPNGWVKKLFIYQREKSITANVVAETTSNVVNIGENIIYAAIGQTINEFSDVRISDVNPDNQTITLEEPITLLTGDNTLTLKTIIGDESNQATIRISSLARNEKIRIRITTWWPDDLSSGNIYKNRLLSFDYNNSNSTQMSFPYFSVNKENYYSTNSQQSITNYLTNRLSGTNNYTENDFFVSNNLIIDYEPPLQLSDRILFENKTNALYYGEKQIVSTGNKFSDCVVGDWILVSDTNDENVKAYQISEIANQNIVFITEEMDLLGPYPVEFNFRIVKHYGLIGIYLYGGNNSISTINNASSDKVNFVRRNIRKDHVFCYTSIPSGFNTDFYRIDTINYFNGGVVINNFQSLTEDITNNYGIMYIFSDKGLEDRSKEVFCQGVYAAEVTQIISSGTNILYLSDVSNISIDDYIQLSGFIEEGTQVDTIDTINKTITLKNSTIPIIYTDIPIGTTITVSPDSVNREQCSVVLNTAPPFEGTNTGLKTQSISSGVWANGFEFDNLYLNVTTSPEELITSTNNYSKTLNIKCNGVDFKFLIQ